METRVGLNDPKAVKRYSGVLAIDTPRESYFGQRFFGVGEGTDKPIMVLTELETGAGEQITYDLSIQLKGAPVEGDNKAEGNEEQLGFYTDNLYIDQSRKPVSAGGKMSRKRTLHNLREVARRRQVEYWARLTDEVLMTYLAGARGVNGDFIYPTSWTGRANNALTAPDSEHHIIAGAGTKVGLVASDKMSLALVDRAVATADMMGGGTQETPKIQQCKVEGGEKRFVMVYNPIQSFDMRTATGDGKWLDINKALNQGLAKNNPISMGGEGEHNGVILHKHQAVIRFNDYGVGTNVPAARALFFGSQAAVIAYGSPGRKRRFDWHEEEFDLGNQLTVSTNCIYGCKKSTFNAKDFGVIAVDTAALPAA